LDPESGGVYMLAAEDLFARLKHLPDLTLSVSMFEIYGQKVRDLLNESCELQALEDGKGVLQLVGLRGVECDAGMADFVRVSNLGRRARSTTATGANATSSRSHAAMLFRLVKRGPTDPNKPKPSYGKFSLIDLAGSERGADAHENTDKTTQMEGRQINTSLLALKEVIRAKELGRSHAPFRQSRLTQVLEEALTGRRCQTLVIGCVSPSEKDLQQTINTLRYAEGLRPGLKKDLAKREKEAEAREAARLEEQRERRLGEEARLAAAQEAAASLRPAAAAAQNTAAAASASASDLVALKEAELAALKYEEERQRLALESALGESEHPAGFLDEFNLSGGEGGALDLMADLEGEEDEAEGAAGEAAALLARAEKTDAAEARGMSVAQAARARRAAEKAAAQQKAAAARDSHPAKSPVLSAVAAPQAKSPSSAAKGRASNAGGGSSTPGGSGKSAAAKEARRLEAEQRVQLEADALRREAEALVADQPGRKTTLRKSLARTSLGLGLGLGLGGAGAAGASADNPAEKGALVASLQGRLADLARALEESEAARASQATALARERERSEEVERTYSCALEKLEGEAARHAREKVGLEQELAQRDEEVEQLCAEVEDREERIEELKVMLKKMLDSAHATQEASQGATQTPKGGTKGNQSAPGSSGGGRATRSSTKTKR